MARKRERGVDLSDDITVHLVSKVTLRLPSGHNEVLELNQVRALASKLSGYLSRQASGPILKEGNFNVPFPSIVEAVSVAFDVDAPTIMGRNRKESVAVARQAAMYLCRAITGRTLQCIGEYFQRDHGTVLHAIEATKARMLRDRFQARMVNLESHLQQMGPQLNDPPKRRN